MRTLCEAYYKSVSHKSSMLDTLLSPNTAIVAILDWSFLQNKTKVKLQLCDPLTHHTYLKSCSFSSKRGVKCVPAGKCNDASCVLSWVIILNPISSALCINFNGVRLNVNLTFTFIPLMYFLWKLKLTVIYN